MLKQILNNILLNLLKVMWIVPIKENRIVFISFNGEQYSDSPKYIYEVFENYKNFSLYWILDDSVLNKVDKLINNLKPNSFKALFFMLTSKAIVTNNYLNTFIPIRRGQIVLNTWHGGGCLKKIGLMANHVTKYDNYFFKIHSKKYTAFTSDSSLSMKFLLRESFGFNGEVLRFGLPRNEILQQDNRLLRKKVRTSLSVQDSYVIMYAPTFRGAANKAKFMDSEMYPDFKLLKEFLQEKFEKKCIILYRGHHSLKKVLLNDCLDVTDYLDMQELLIAADALITDFSSCMWDMAVAQKPVFIYAPDMDTYIREQGFYIEPDKWPFSISKTVNELINNIYNHDDNEYIKRVNKYFQMVGSFENINSNKDTCDWLLDKMKMR